MNREQSGLLARPPTVVFVETDSVDLELAMRALQDSEVPNLQAVALTGGTMFRRWLATTEEPATLVILGKLAPRSDALRLAHELRSNESHRDTSIVLFTGYATTEIERQAEEIGIAKVVEKPFDFQAYQHTFLEILREFVFTRAGAAEV